VTEIADPRTNKHGLWVIDLAGNVSTRLTFGQSGDHFPIWSPDGSRIVFASEREGPWSLYQKLASGAGTETPIYKTGATLLPTDWSRDGRFIVYAQGGVRRELQLWVLPLSGGRAPVSLPATGASEEQGSFSPDGRWIAYTSNETGGEEVYVRDFPATGAKWQISKAGGSHARWRGDGKELFYVAPDAKLMAVGVNSAHAIEVGPTQTLFQTSIPLPARAYSYTATADGQRFLVVTPMEDPAPAPVTVVLDWTSGLRR
jgi:Tol biopolymer transport system component